MPEISRFLGIVIRMYMDDHNPPHFHAYYNEFEAIIDINSFSVIAGNLPPKALGLVIEWSALHKKELMENWELAFSRKPVFKIKPLQ